MRFIGANGGFVRLDLISSFYISEEKTPDGKKVYAIKFYYRDGVGIFDVYPTQEKAERYLKDLISKLNSEY